MARGITKKEMKRDEFVEAAFNLEHWLEENWMTVLKWAGAVALVGLTVAGWFWWSAERQRASTDLLSEGLGKYAGAAEAGGGDGYGEALSLFEQAAGKGGGSAVGQVARYYRGLTLIQMGRAEEAIPVLEELAEAGDSSALADAARAVLANALAEAERTEEAIVAYREIADQSGPYAEQALLRTGILLRQQGKLDEAREALQEVLDLYPQGSTSAQAEQILERMNP